MAMGAGGPWDISSEMASLYAWAWRFGNPPAPLFMLPRTPGCVGCRDADCASCRANRRELGRPSVTLALVER